MRVVELRGLGFREFRGFRGFRSLGLWAVGVQDVVLGQLG